MIRSMTAFARLEIKQEWGTACWELRSVNQRYLEIFTRLPEQFRSLEPMIRDAIRQRLTRGKVECALRFEPNLGQEGSLVLNKELVLYLIQAADWVKLQCDEGQIDPLRLLNWPGVISAQQQDLDTLSGQIMSALESALDELIQAREREGQLLKELLIQRLQGIRTQVTNVRAKMPQILEWQREKLQNRLAEAQLQLDDNRLEQELILLAQRIDVAEELDRLEAHVKETELTLNKPEAVGRRLDFMMQEFNREANTLASKSINAEVTTSAIELKVLIEQMREQIQNIE